MKNKNYLRSGADAKISQEISSNTLQWRFPQAQFNVLFSLIDWWQLKRNMRTWNIYRIYIIFYQQFSTNKQIIWKHIHLFGLLKAPKCSNFKFVCWFSMTYDFTIIFVRKGRIIIKKRNAFMTHYQRIFEQRFVAIKINLIFPILPNPIS